MNRASPTNNDFDLLQTLLGNGFNDQQINALTAALTSIVKQEASNPSTLNPLPDWRTTQRWIMTQPIDQLHRDLPSILRRYCLNTTDAYCTFQVLIEFRERHKVPVIE